MMTLRPVAGGILLSVCVACGGGSSGGNTVNGSIRGRSLQAADAISGNLVITPAGSAFNIGVIVLSSASAMCAKVTASQESKNSQYLALSVTDFSSSGQSNVPSGPGTYSLSSIAGQLPPKLATAVYLQTDGTCFTSLAATGTSGTVTLTSASSGSYSGTFDITFDTGDHATGSFTASNCGGLSQFGQSATTCI
jgi:hypothetical protein